MPSKDNKFKKIVKRNGRIVDFDGSKIQKALIRAGKATKEFDESIAKTLAIKVLQLAESLYAEIPSVEDIQDVVEQVLLNSPFKQSARAYVIYREQHAKIREIANKAGVDLIDQYLEKLDWQGKENSNMSFSLQGLHNYISSETNKN